MSNLLISLLYLTVFFVLSLGGYRLYKILNRKINESQTGWQLAGFSLLLFAAFALLLIGGLYIVIELYAFLAQPES